MRLLPAFFVLLAAASAADQPSKVEVFGYTWTVPVLADWQVEPGPPQVLKLLVARPSTQPRRPSQFALAETPAYAQVTLEADVKRTNGTSLILVYAYKDANHFNYAHLSSDMASKHPVHNGIFHVYGGDRVRISREDGPGSLPTEDWHKVKLTYDASAGRVKVSVDGQTSPSLEGVDLSLGPGRVGLGSFFETADFRNVKITGKP